MESLGTDKNSPAYESGCYTKQLDEVTICGDLEAGTLHVRARRHAYLPKEEAEDSEDYQYKLNRAVVHPGFVRTLATLVGLVFKQEIKLEADVPEAIRGTEATDTAPGVEGWAENIDNAGASLNQFAKSVFAKAIRDGHAFILVDMPPPLPEGATRADEMAAKRRPYWVLREKSQATNWRTEVVNGQSKLSQITFKECTYEADGAFGEAKVTRYRVLRPGSWQLWREIKEGAQKQTILESEGTTSLAEIPVAVVYADKQALLESRPLLIELAHIVISHYQKRADLNVYLHLTSRPLWWVRMGRREDRFTVGPRSIQYLNDPAGQVGVAETSGAALSAARTDLKDLEEEMALFGQSLLVTKSTARTATESIQDDIAEKSPLQSAADSLKDGIEQALIFTAQFADPQAMTGGSANLGKLETLTMTPEMARVIFDAIGSKLSHETGYKWLQTGKLPENFDPKTEADSVQAQASAAAAAALAAFDRGQV